MIPKSQNCFYLAFLQIMMHQIHVSWILQSNTYWLLKDLTSLLLTTESFETFILMLTMPSPIIVHTKLNDNRLFVSFCIIVVIILVQSFSTFYLVLFFIKWLYNELLNFLFCQQIPCHPTSICSKLVLLPGALLFTLSISLNKFLLVEIPGTYLAGDCQFVYITKCISSVATCWLSQKNISQMESYCFSFCWL